MAEKFDALKYVVLGAGAVLAPALLGSVVGSISFLGTAIWNGITIGGILLAGVGVAAFDMLFYTK